MSLKKLYRTIRSIVVSLVLSCRSRGFRLSAISLSLRIVQLCREHRYEPVEAFRLGYFSSDFNDSCRIDFLSRKNTTRLQESLNPSALSPLFKNKAIFYRHCVLHKLPVPRMFGLFSQIGKTIHAYQGELLIPVVDKEAFFASLPTRFAIKPVVGSLGDGFRVITRTAEGFVDHHGKIYTLKQFLLLLSASSHIGMLMQEIIENHPDIAVFSGVAGLQTIRIITLVGADYQVEILSAFFKTITSPTVVIDTDMDNLRGNLEVLIDPSDGSLTEACYLDGFGKGIVLVNNHPVSGRVFNGVVMPCWPQVCQLARSAALAAIPVRTIGWDIAVTDHGPCLIEGNIWWDPPNQHRVMGKISERMSVVIEQLARS